MALARIPLPKSTIRLSGTGKMLCGQIPTILLSGNLKVSVTKVIEIFSPSLVLINVDSFFFLTADWAKGKVPEDFETKLLEHYRNYLDGSGNVIPERQENFQAFLYFIDRILPSVNYEINNYKAIAKKTKLPRHCFTTTDKAFGLVAVENYSRS